MARLILLFLLAMPFASYAASFDCSKARSLVEITICNDAELSRLDDELGQIYRRAKSVAPDKKAFQVTTQVDWQRRERDCRTRSCIVNWYSERKSSLLAVIESSGATGSSCLPYQSKQTILIGRLVRKTYPGRPNYESVSHGDEPETGFYLMLDKPVCTAGSDEDPMTAPLANVSQVQLVLDNSTYTMLRPLISKRIKISGQLFSAHTGHHHAPLLLDNTSLMDVVGR
jgi:uncharacterized protein YecT (DUF1311 family)